MKKSIEIAGTLLSLDDIMSVGAIVKAGANYPYYFQVIYKSHQGSALSFSVIDGCVEGESSIYLIGTGLKIHMKNPNLNEIREKIVKIISAND